ncbi:MAG TPA: pitrilysin family protein, partial [Smithellaceae bacterium]|nr:pitrilysin family protein [Smithellaceae bacterium]
GTKTIGTKDFAAEKKILDKVDKTGRALDKEKQKGKKANQTKIKEFTVRLKILQEEHKKYVIPNEIDRLYTENGGLDMNASTGQDVTTYQVSLPANKIELWARIEADRMMNPVFREFYTERDVVLEERRQRIEADPSGKLYEQFLATAFQSHPYRRPVIGWQEDIARLDIAAMNKYFQKYKSPQTTVIAVVGSINPEKTLKLIEKYFGDIPPVQAERTLIAPEPPQTELRRVNVEFDANPLMIIGFHKPTAPAFDDYVLDVLENILTKGRSSRLYNLLINEMQVAQSISTANGTPGTLYPNLFAFFARPRQPYTNEKIEAIIWQEIEKLKSAPVTDVELAKAKNRMKMDFISGFDSNSEMASILSYYEVLLGDFNYFSRYLSTIDKITPADIQNAVKKYFTRENMTIATLTRKKK